MQFIISQLDQNEVWLMLFIESLDLSHWDWRNMIEDKKATPKNNETEVGGAMYLSSSDSYS